MNKLPAFQFYPADWRKDPAVQAMSFFDRGVWFEILCLMHESEDRGKLLLCGRPMPDEVLARLLGLPKAKVVKTLAVILEYGVASLDEHGILVNRRMVRDEEIRKIRTEAGKKGGNPTLVNQKPSKQVKQKSTPSSSSSSSVSTTEEDSATQAETAEKPSPVSRRIWTDGVQLLTESGIKNHDARSLLGKLGRDYGQTQLAECIAATMAANPVNPEEFLIGTLKNRKNGNGSKPKPFDPGKDAVFESKCPDCGDADCNGKCSEARAA